MFDHYMAAMFSLSHARDVARSALPDAPVEPYPGRRHTDKDRRSQVPLQRTDGVDAQAPLASPNLTRSGSSSGRVACPCGEWGVPGDERDGWLSLCRHLYPQLDQELNAWEQANGWLYR
jgi:hypothetical protein